MILSRNTQPTKIEIWSPKWSTRTVKIAAHKVGVHNSITFPKSKSLEGEWYISGNKVRQYPVTQMVTQAGSMLDIYEVKLSDLQPLEYQKTTYVPFDDRTGKTLDDKEFTVWN